MELPTGIHKLDCVRRTNAWLVVAPDGLYLVDTGMPGNAPRILSQIDALGLDRAELRSIILTHADIDHAGSAAELRRAAGVPIAAHAGEEPVLRGEREGKHAKGVVGVVFRLLRPFLRYETFAPDRLLEDGERIGPFWVIHAPGHTAGSICLLADGGVLFSGDALLTNRAGMPLPPHVAMAADADTALASLRKLADREFTVLLPGHGAPLLRDAGARVREMVSFMT